MVFAKSSIKFYLPLIFISLSFFTGCSKLFGGGSSEGYSGDGTVLSDQDLALSQKKWDGGNIPLAQGDGVFKDVFFDFNSSLVRSEDRETVKKNAQLLLSDPSLHAEVEGHCDKRGTAEYNLALGDERARSVAGMLSSLGVKASQLSTISYGEEIPLDPQDNEEAYAKNRRAHLTVYRGPKK